MHLLAQLCFSLLQFTPHTMSTGYLSHYSGVGLETGQQYLKTFYWPLLQKQSYFLQQTPLSQTSYFGHYSELQLRSRHLPKMQFIFYPQSALYLHESPGIGIFSGLHVSSSQQQFSGHFIPSHAYLLQQFPLLHTLSELQIILEHEHDPIQKP